MFVDSDSVVEPGALRKLVQPLADPRVGAVCGHADVLNVRETWLTRMQAVRYFVAFRVVKAAESVFNAVTCCSGCFSAYRREAIMPRLEWWESQTFLGVESTFGDDRSLTNCVLRDWRILYEKDAVSHTIVPTTFRAFVKQQTRWKRSWTRESLMVSRFIWRKHPVAAAFTYLSIVLPLIAPVAALHSIAWGPLIHDSTLPLIYVAGLYSLAIVYSLYYVLFQDRYSVIWMYGVLFVFFYLAIMLWQTYYAIATCRTAAWGTRPGDGRAHGWRRWWCMRWRPRSSTRVARPVRAPAPARIAARSMLAMLLLPLSIAPVLLLGPRCCAPPWRSWRGVGRSPAGGAGPAARSPTPTAPGENAWALPTVSLGPVYGRWLTFPQRGQTRPGDPQLGPEGLAR